MRTARPLSTFATKDRSAPLAPHHRTIQRNTQLLRSPILPGTSPKYFARHGSPHTPVQQYTLTTRSCLVLPRSRQHQTMRRARARLLRCAHACRHSNYICTPLALLSTKVRRPLVHPTVPRSQPYLPTLLNVRATSRHDNGITDQPSQSQDKP